MLALSTVRLIATYSFNALMFIRNRTGRRKAPKEVHHQVYGKRDAYDMQQRCERGRHPSLVVRILKLRVFVRGCIVHLPMAQRPGRQIKVPSLFTDYRIQSNANNEITLTLSSEALVAALRSALSPSGTGSSSMSSFASDAEVVMKYVYCK